MSSTVCSAHSCMAKYAMQMQVWHAGRVQSTVVGGFDGIQMFRTSKIKEGADHSSLERDI